MDKWQFLCLRGSKVGPKRVRVPALHADHLLDPHEHPRICGTRPLLVHHPCRHPGLPKRCDHSGALRPGAVAIFINDSHQPDLPLLGGFLVYHRVLGASFL